MDKTLDALKDIKKNDNKEKRDIFLMYVIFFPSFMGSFSPKGFVSIFSIMICVCTLATIYAVRSKSEEDSLLENQCTFLIRTFWKTNLLLVFSFIFSAIYMIFTIDYMPLKPCASFIEGYFTSAIRNWNNGVISSILASCSTALLKHNTQTIIFGSFIAFSPSLGYLVFRFGRGIKYLKKLKIIPVKKL